MWRKHWTAVAVVFVWVLAAASYSHAIPAFSRQYGTSCSTCHVDFPKLNDFGEAFKGGVTPMFWAKGSKAQILSPRPFCWVTSRAASVPLTALKGLRDTMMSTRVY